MIDSELLIHNLCTKGFHIIEDFLELHQCQLIQVTAQEMYAQGLFRGAKIGLNLESHKNRTIRADEIFWLDEHEENSAIQNYLKRIQQLAQLLNQELFLGLHEFETHLAAYQPGSYYKKHVDQFATKKNRKISCVYYLNKDWCAELGGELKLYNQEEQLIQVILPQENRFICFNSELPHEVCLTHQPRYSIAGWLKTRSDLMC
ncbi:2OG-Fe(II) oxygenase [Legionella cincinnatiensis]|uniref:2OG-Fe(II) oxygenase n=1 Tax=Legionella cincinnatiensis TaxID=28085 RepID=A0A378ILY8_9GAMM|nr:2OG-Fe(II) oxygenase [Legionella cincinnatiensis]KTC83966.1 2OG-Fe(II) oxygenase [Legionella cincinnatiensis]STX36258.1 2OG-Fe(II) oxygenase [Legionella cincinnatiensis]